MSRPMLPVIEAPPRPQSDIHAHWTPCPLCLGRGHVYMTPPHDQKPCSKCWGSGMAPVLIKGSEFVRFVDLSVA